MSVRFTQTFSPGAVKHSHGKSPICRWFTHSTWQFSMAIFHYRRVYIYIYTIYIYIYILYLIIFMHIYIYAEYIKNIYKTWFLYTSAGACVSILRWNRKNDGTKIPPILWGHDRAKKCRGNLWDNTLTSGIDMENQDNMETITVYNKHMEIYSLMISGLFHVKFDWNLVG